MPYSTRDNRVLNEPLGRSLRSFARTTHSTHFSAALCFDMLALFARSVHSLAHSLRSLPHRPVKIPKSVFTLKSRFKEKCVWYRHWKRHLSVHHAVVAEPPRVEIIKSRFIMLLNWLLVASFFAIISVSWSVYPLEFAVWSIGPHDPKRLGVG